MTEPDRSEYPTDEPDRDSAGTVPPGTPSWARGVRLRRPHEGRIVGGVAAGIAEYLAVDVAVVRVAFVVLTFLGGVGVPAYLAAWLLVPDECEPTSVVEDWLSRHGHAA